MKIYLTDDVFISEPGYYKENDFGIRIEDVVMIVPASTKVVKELLISSQNYDSL